MSDSTSNPNHKAGLANNSSWNASGFAFAPNTNTMDSDSMPSDQAQLARDKTAQIMAALNAGDTAKANALMGKSETPGQLLPGMGRLKKKLNARKVNALEGEAVEEQQQQQPHLQPADTKSKGFFGRRKSSNTEKVVH